MNRELAEQKASKMMHLSFAVGEMYDSVMLDAKTGKQYTKDDPYTLELFWKSAQETRIALREMAQSLDRAALIKSTGERVGK